MKLEKACSKYGAQMGRLNQYPDDRKAPIKLRLKALRLDDSYDAGGAYWGATPGTGIFWAYNSKENVQLFTRARNRAAAKQEFKESLPNATFHPSKDDKQQLKGITPPKIITTKNGKVYTYPSIIKSPKADKYKLKLWIDKADPVYNACLQGIDAHLEAFSAELDTFEWAEGTLHCEISAGSMPILLRRLIEQAGTEKLVATIIKDLGIRPLRSKPKK